MRIVLAALAALVLTACASADLEELSHTAGDARFDTAAVAYDDSAESVPLYVKTYLKNRLISTLQEDNGFAIGSALTLVLTIEAYDEGNRTVRWVSTGLGGSGKLMIATRFVDAAGRVLAETRTAGSISFGLLGGSYNEVMDDVATAIAAYARERFLRRPVSRPG